MTKSTKKVAVNITCDEFFVADALREIANKIEESELTYDEIRKMTGEHYVMEIGTLDSQSNEGNATLSINEENATLSDKEVRKQSIIAFVKAIGNQEHDGKPYWVDIDTVECFVSWAYWDDDDAYTKMLYALFIDCYGNLICLWDGNSGEAYDSLEEELQEYIYDHIMEWAAEITNKEVSQTK